MSGSGQDIFGASSNAMQQGAQTTANMTDPNAYMNSINSFMNPYQSQVLDQSLQRLGTDRSMAMNDIKASAAQQGAYGGSRQGVIEGTMMGQFDQNASEMISGVNRQGYLDAAGLAGNNAAIMGGAANNLFGQGLQGYGMGQQSMENQASVGAQQQQFLQQLLGQAGNQYEGYTQHPYNMLQLMAGTLAGNPLNAQNTSTQTQQTNQGLMPYLSLAAGLGGAYLGSPFAAAAAT